MRMYSPGLAFHYVDGSVTKLMQSSTNASDHCAIARGEQTLGRAVYKDLPFERSPSLPRHRRLEQGSAKGVGVRLASNRDKIFLRLYLAVRFYLQNRYIFEWSRGESNP